MTKQTKQVELPEMIREYRKHLGLTQIEFTRRYGMKSTILGSLWESGKREAPFVVMQEVFNWKLAQAQQEAVERERENIIDAVIKLSSKYWIDRYVGIPAPIVVNKHRFKQFLSYELETLQKEQE